MDRHPRIDAHAMTQDRTSTIHRRLTIGLQVVIVISIGLSIYEQQWFNTAIATGILGLTLLPALLGRRLHIYIPAEFELVTVGFIFAALFLGETRDYYDRFWWWDIALHATSGSLLGVLGVLLVYVLNEDPKINMRMKPGFVAVFAFTFAMAAGALWEIFEFGMDQLFGMNMQKSGLVDTMTDLIVDAAGALVVSLVGYFYMKRGVRSFVESWIVKFIDNNPRMFRRKDDPGSD